MKYTKSLVLAVLIASAGLGLTACSGTTASATATAPSVAPVTPTTAAKAADPAKSSRGNIIKNFGEGAGITDTTTGKSLVNFTINSIKPGACTEKYASAPTNGNIVIVEVSAETTPDLAGAIVKTYSMSSYDWKFIDANGTTFNGNLGSTATYGCLPDGATFPSAGMGPGEKVTAKLVLDVPAPTGTLVLKAPFSSTGWEYKF